MFLDLTEHLEQAFLDHRRDDAEITLRNERLAYHSDYSRTKDADYRARRRVDPAWRERRRQARARYREAHRETIRARGVVADRARRADRDAYNASRRRRYANRRIISPLARSHPLHPSRRAE